MPTARPDTASIASGADLYAGRYPLFPAWLGSVGEWSALPDSQLSTSGAGWSGTSPGGTTNYLGLMTAWSGGVLNTTGVYRSGSFVAGTFLVIFGGGHGDYGGNEVMAYGPLEASPTWSRITDPTVPGPEDVVRSGSNPASRHTYDTLVYLPTQNKMLCIGVPGYFSVGATANGAELFDFAQDPGAATPWEAEDYAFSWTGGEPSVNLLTAYDSVADEAWAVGFGNSNRLIRYVPATGVWTAWAIDNPNAPSNVKGAMDPTSKVMAFIGDDGTLQAVDLRAPTATVYAPSVSGTGPSAGAIEWDEDGGRFVVWTGSGKAVYFLAPGADPYSGGNAWAWTSDTPTGGVTPATQTTNGTFGRLRMVNGSGWRGLLCIGSPSAAGSFYRMA